MMVAEDVGGWLLNGLDLLLIKPRPAHVDACERALGSSRRSRL